MADRTVAKRVKHQRDTRVEQGWVEVRVWVPTEDDAEDVRNLAAERRAKAEELHGLTERSKVTPETQERIAAAIAKTGSAAYTHKAGAVMDLMTKLAEEDDLRGFSHAVIVLARAKPTYAASVMDYIPGKISNFLMRHRGVTLGDFLAWEQSNPNWGEQLKNVARDPSRFELVVETMAKDIKSYQKQLDA